MLSVIMSVFHRLYVASALFNLVHDVRISSNKLRTIAEHAILFASTYLLGRGVSI